MAYSVCPSVAVEWIVSNSSSDVELAILSNVSTLWRDLVIRTLCTVDSANRSSQDLGLLQSRVLLVSITQRLVSNKGITSDDEQEAFCVAWFAPENIRETWVSRDVEESMDDDCSFEGIDYIRQSSMGSNAPTSVSEPFAPNGAQSYGDEERSDEGKRGSRHSRRSRSSATSLRSLRAPAVRKSSLQESLQNSRPEGDVVLVAEEWTGYQTIYDVLCHFGYTRKFLSDLLEYLPSSPERDAMLGNHFSAYQTTLAVRGATVARPESYCLCYDEEKIREASMYPAVRSGSSEKYQEMEVIRVRERSQALRRRARRRRELQREVLPRIVQSNDPMSKPPVAVQFLNTQGDHAVCMVTPPFVCGPLAEPITIFCVGIATEDGCFLSGLHHRFELGHLYPGDELKELTELSSICVATERWETKADTMIPPQSSPDGARNVSGSRSNGSDDSSVENSESDLDSALSCECIFHGVGEKVAEMDRDPEVIARGSLGPGSWHCYVAMCDGQRTRIRVDGVEEPVVTIADTAKPHLTMLDGLTIGSDHCFGLSLCSGQGPGGEGAIAEVAVFHGSMNEQDVAFLERKLMQKHSIPKPALGFREQNEMERKAHALFCAGVGAVGGNPLPLHFLTQHESVAWVQNDPVSGKPRKVGKIGVKNGAESSDW